MIVKESCDLLQKPEEKCLRMLVDKVAMDPLQLRVKWYKFHHALTQATHWDMQNKENSNLTGFACPSAWLASQHGGYRDVTVSCKGSIDSQYPHICK